jgi:glycerol-3-phosphate acyltransferase PlsY
MLLISLYVLLFIISYVLGSFPTAYLVVKKYSGKDIRAEGTGNVGAMNTARATGKWYLFVLVAVIDAIKGFVAIVLARQIHLEGFDVNSGYLVAAFAVVLGHCYSLYFKLKFGKFDGGKAMSTLAGVAIALDFVHLFIPGLTALFIPIILTGNLFLAQFTANLALPFIAFFLAPVYFPVACAVAVPVFIKQWPRVIPMIQGKEPKWYWKKR